MVDERYEIIKQVGSGAYGVVASALDRQRNKKVAIKKVSPSLMDRLSMPSKILLMRNAYSGKSNYCVVFRRFRLFQT